MPKRSQQLNVRNLRFQVIFRLEPEGGFTVIVPTLPGCITYGRNLTEARRMVADAIRAYLGSLRKHREPIPSDGESFIGTIELTERRSKAAAYA